MTLITIASTGGAPGATTLAVGLAAVWPSGGDTVTALIEADPDGGRMGAELGVGVEPGLVSLSLAARATDGRVADLIGEHGADMNGWWLVPAPPSCEQTVSVLARSAASLCRSLDGEDVHCIVDAGRLTTRSPAMPFAVHSERVLIVTPGDFAALATVPSRVSSLLAAGCAVDVVVAGSTPWTTSDIAAFVGSDVLAVLPRVRARLGSRSMRGGEWSQWWSSVRDLAGALHSAPATGHPHAEVAQ